MEKGVRMKNEDNILLEEIVTTIKSPWDKREANMLNPLVLAYMGDAVYEKHIRSYLIKSCPSKVNQLHKKAIHFVKAQSQAAMVHFLMEELTEEEKRVVKRGRNAKSGTTPKNANLSDYQYATGFEALIGYLSLIEDKERLMYIIGKTIKFIQEEENSHEKR